MPLSAAAGTWAKRLGSKRDQFAAGRKRHFLTGRQFAAGPQHGVAGTQFEARQADLAVLVAGFGGEHEAGIGEAERQLLAGAADGR